MTPVATATTTMRVKDLSCPYCQGLISVPVYCVSLPCRHCKLQLDLSYSRGNPRKENDLIKHSDFSLKKYHRLEVSKMYVGNAVISGKFKGHLYASGTVKILEHGEFYGKISCHKFLIKKGGIFEGTIHLMHDQNLEILPVKNYNQLIMK